LSPACRASLLDTPHWNRFHATIFCPVRETKKGSIGYHLSGTLKTYFFEGPRGIFAIRVPIETCDGGHRYCRWGSGTDRMGNDRWKGNDWWNTSAGPTVVFRASFSLFLMLSSLSFSYLFSISALLRNKPALRSFSSLYNLPRFLLESPLGVLTARFPFSLILFYLGAGRACWCSG